MSIVETVIVVMLVINMLGSISMIDKPRIAITRGQAIITSMIDIILIIFLVK